MSGTGTSETFHLTREDIRKTESKESAAHGGNVPAGSDASALKSIIDETDKSKAAVIEERKAALPLPDQPPVEAPTNSADGRTTNIGSGAEPTASFSHGNDALREPATGDSAVRTNPATSGTNVQGQGVGREGKDGLGGLPSDAAAQGSKGKAGLAETTGKDYGYPEKSDPSSGTK